MARGALTENPVTVKPNTIDTLDPNPHGWCLHSVGSSKTATLVLPPPIANLVRAGEELGTADDKVFGSKNNKQAGGTVGHLTRGFISYP